MLMNDPAGKLPTAPQVCIIGYLSMAMVQVQSSHLHNAYKLKKNELALKCHASLLDSIRSTTSKSRPFALYLN
jgi:hypothetical protein